jgi:hypothetical protein
VTGGEGIVLGFLGLGLVVLSFFIGRPKRPAPADAAPAAPYTPPVSDDTPRSSGIFG